MTNSAFVFSFKKLHFFCFAIQFFESVIFNAKKCQTDKAYKCKQELPKIKKNIHEGSKLTFNLFEGLINV
jgi:hypothetical protein